MLKSNKSLSGRRDTPRDDVATPLDDAAKRLNGDQDKAGGARGCAGVMAVYGRNAAVEIGGANSACRIAAANITLAPGSTSACVISPQ
jgi:hypothetical protein